MRALLPFALLAGCTSAPALTHDPLVACVVAVVAGPVVVGLVCGALSIGRVRALGGRR